MEGLTAALIAFAVTVVNLLPDTPFTFLEELDWETFSPYIQYLNWFVPVGLFVRILASWTACIGVYYVFQVVLRWIKVVE